MFEERRNNINGRPPMAGSGPAQQAYRNGNGYTTKRRGSPPKAGWDRSYPLEPIPPNGHYEKNASRVPAAGQHRYVRPRGVSLERGANHFNEVLEIFYWYDFCLRVHSYNRVYNRIYIALKILRYYRIHIGKLLIEKKSTAVGGIFGKKWSMQKLF